MVILTVLTFILCFQRFLLSSVNSVCIVAVIGKGGENIAMIQSETGVKVQFAQGKSSLTVFKIYSQICLFLKNLTVNKQTGKGFDYSCWKFQICSNIKHCSYMVRTPVWNTCKRMEFNFPFSRS